MLHLYPVFGLGGLVLAFALRAFLKLARVIVIAVAAVAIIAALHGGILP